MGDAAGYQAIETTHLELRRENHQCKQQCDGWHVDRPACLIKAEIARGQQHNQPEQRHARTVDCQSRHAPQRHAEIDQQKNGDGQRGHGEGWRFLAARVRSRSAFRRMNPSASFWS